MTATRWYLKLTFVSVQISTPNLIHRGVFDVSTHADSAAIFDGDERETVSASALQLRGMGCTAISEATLYGVALMFALLTGGAK